MTTELDDASPPWCFRLFEELYAADERATALAKTLTPRQLNWTPAPGVWSIGQCLEHLYVTNEVYLGPMSTSLEGRQQAVVQDITPGWFGRWFIRNFIEPSSKVRRVRAPRKVRPGAQVEPSILDRFLNSNHRARELVHRARNYDVNGIRFKNPFIPVIRFTVGTGLEILSKHQRRHLLQAERIREALEFPEREANGRW
ncbi:MAG TPA: DinB family protein [Gemmatimonadaceae bacterium]